MQILPDTPEDNAFNEHVEVISDIIVNSFPQFTIGIFGRWGVGKTSFLKSLQARLISKYKEDVIVVFFDAWRYDQENIPIIEPLLKELYFAVKLNKSHIAKKLMTVLNMVIQVTSMYFTGNPISFSQEIAKIDSLAKASGEMGSYDAFKYLENMLRKIRNKNKRFRIVLLIDDLDRCSKNNLVKILNSLKLFLDLEGIILVMALDDNAVNSALMEAGIPPKEYLSKFFQVIVRLPEWDTREINSLLDKYIQNNLREEWMNKSIKENINYLRERLSEVLKDNATPRALKKFLNIFLVRYALSRKYLKKKKVNITQSELVKVIIDICVADYIWPDFLKLIERGGLDLFSRIKKAREQGAERIEKALNNLKLSNTREFEKFIKTSRIFDYEYSTIKEVLKVRSSVELELSYSSQYNSPYQVEDVNITIVSTGDSEQDWKEYLRSHIISFYHDSILNENRDVQIIKGLSRVDIDSIIESKKFEFVILHETATKFYYNENYSQRIIEKIAKIKQLHNPPPKKKQLFILVVELDIKIEYIETLIKELEKLKDIDHIFIINWA